MFLLPEVPKPFLFSLTHLLTGLLDTHSSFKLCWLHLFLEGHDLCPIPVAHLIAVLPAPHVKLAAGGTSLLCCPGAVSKVTGGSCAPQACPHGEINSPGGDSGSVCGWMPSLPILWRPNVEACSTWFFRERPLSIWASIVRSPCWLSTPYWLSSFPSHLPYSFVPAFWISATCSQVFVSG